MILPRFEDLEIEWARLKAGGTPSSKGISFLLRGRLITDGGPDGLVATLWLPGVKEPLIGSRKWRPEDIASGKTRHQAWREGSSVILAVLAFLPQMQGGTILYYSDCSCVVKALRDGSGNSDSLQEQALELWQLMARYGIMLFSGWVPGDRVIDMGADGLSRSEGKDWGGYALNSEVWQRVRDTATTAGKTLTVDLFASSSNNKCQRFHTQGTEGADASHTRYRGSKRI